MPGKMLARPGLLLMGATVLAVPFVLLSTFSQFLWFDDEGTLLIWFRSWLDGFRMYDDVYSLYGPLYSATYGVLYGILHVPLTHTSGRLIAAALWLVYTAEFAALCFRLTRSLSAAAFSYVLVLIWLAPLMNTPGHPEELGLVLMAGTLLLVHRAALRPGMATLAALAAVATGLALVKINFGAIVGSGLLLVLLRATAPAAWTRVLSALTAAGMLLLPAAVMMLLAGQEWVRLYWLFSTAAIGSALLVFYGQPTTRVLRPADWPVMAAAGGAVVILVVGGMVFAGSSARAILNATLLQNAGFIRNWNIPLHLGPQGLLAIGVSACAAVAYRMTAHQPGLARFRALGIAALKSGCVVAGLALLAWPGQPFRVLVPFCWLLMVPPPGLPPRDTMARSAAGLVGATMSLYAFPVAGGQVIIGALVMIALLPLLASDALAGLRELGLLPPSAGGVWPRVAAVAAVLLLALFMTARSAQVYFAGVPLGLPGTALIRIDRDTAQDLRWVTEQLASCSASYSMPGLLSFAFWTGHRLPTPVNVNGVLNFVSSEGQERIVQALSQQPDLCVVFHPGLLRFFDRGQVRADPPLLHYIQSGFTTAAERHGYIIMKRSPAKPYTP